MRFWIVCETSRSNAGYGYCRTGVPPLCMHMRTREGVAYARMCYPTDLYRTHYY